MLWWVKTRKCPSGKVLRAEGTAAANIKSSGVASLGVWVGGGGWWWWYVSPRCQVDLP